MRNIILHLLAFFNPFLGKCKKKKEEMALHEKGRRNFGGVQSGAVHRVCYLVFWLPVQSCAGVWVLFPPVSQPEAAGHRIKRWKCYPDWWCSNIRTVPAPESENRIETVS